LTFRVGYRDAPTVSPERLKGRNHLSFVHDDKCESFAYRWQVVTPLGIGPGRCREALGLYRGRIADLARLLSASAGQRRFGEALTVLDDLMVALEVDTLSRRGSRGQHRLSTAETEFFMPTVTRVRDELQALSRERPSGDWLPALREIDQVLDDAARAVDVLERAERQAARLDAQP